MQHKAQKAADDAKTATTADEAKDNLARAVDAKKAIDALTTAEPKPAVSQAAATAVKEAQSAYDDKKRSEESLCGSGVDGNGPRAFCIVYGLFAASLSQVRVSGEGSSDGSGHVSGQSSHRLTSIAVPFAGLRFLPQFWAGAKSSWGFVSLDIAGYSAFLTQSIAATEPAATKNSCSTTGGDFERKLPCDADASVHPYVGGYIGVTVGKSGLAYLTIAPFTMGVAQVGTMPELRRYIGWSIGAIQLNGSL